MYDLHNGVVCTVYTIQEMYSQMTDATVQPFIWFSSSTLYDIFYDFQNMPWRWLNKPKIWRKEFCFTDLKVHVRFRNHAHTYSLEELILWGTDCLIGQIKTISPHHHGGLSQWGRSNRPRIRPGTVKSLNAPWELS